MKVSPSILAADFGNLQRECEMLNNSEADYVHIDVMDGVFVPNISLGMPVTKALKKYCSKPLDVHLMIVDPQRYIDTFAALGAHIINVHYEACTHLDSTINHIHSLGIKAAVTLNPSSPVSLLEDILPMVDMVLLMSVNPGFGGQKFIPNTLNKIERLTKLREQTGSHALIEIDGGINEQTAHDCAKAGANILVAGSYVFGSADPHEVIKTLKNIR